MRHALLPISALLLALTPDAMGQVTEEDVLSGPTVTQEEEGAPTTIVRRSFDGTLERPEGLPELAALEVLSLDADARAAIDAVIAEREAAIDAILSEEIDLFGRVIQAFQSGAGGRSGSDADRRAFMTLMREVREAVRPIAARGTLREEIEGALTGEALDDFVRMLDEFHAAEQDTREQQPTRERRGVRQGGRQRAFASLLREFGASYERVIVQRVDDFNALMDDLDVDAETKGVIQTAVQGSIGAMTDDPEGYDQRALLREILAELSPEQRRTLIEELRRLGRDGGGRSNR